MPRGALLLILILLIGGYFFFSPKGASEERLPSLELRGVVKESTDGFLVGVDGTLTLPEEREYNVQGEVYVKVDGVKVKSARISSLVKGPSTIPLSLAGAEVASGEVSVGAEVTVTFDNRRMPFSVEVPVTFPPPSARLLLPVVSVGLKDFLPTGGGYDATLLVLFRNPNSFSVTVEGTTVEVGGNAYPADVGQLGPGDTREIPVPVAVEGNTVEGVVRGSIKWGGVRKEFSFPFRVALPSVPPVEPYFSLSADVSGMSEKGLDLEVNVKVENRGSVPVTVKNVRVVVRKGDVEQTKEVGDVTLGPYEAKSYSLSFTAIPFFVGGHIELAADENVVLSSPIPLVSPSLLKEPEVNIWVEDLNGGGIIHVVLTNPNEFNVWVKGFDVIGESGGTELFEYEPIEFELPERKEITVGSVDDPLPLIPGDTWVRVVFSYGLRDLGLMQEVNFVTLYEG